MHEYSLWKSISFMNIKLAFNLILQSRLRFYRKNDKFTMVAKGTAV